MLYYCYLMTRKCVFKSSLLRMFLLSQKTLKNKRQRDKRDIKMCLQMWCKINKFTFERSKSERRKRKWKKIIIKIKAHRLVSGDYFTYWIHQLPKWWKKKMNKEISELNDVRYCTRFYFRIFSYRVIQNQNLQTLIQILYYLLKFELNDDITWFKQKGYWTTSSFEEAFFSLKTVLSISFKMLKLSGLAWSHI